MVEQRSRNRVRLGDLITGVRKRRQWTQADLAEAADVGLRSLVKVESGEKVSPKTLRAIERAIGWEAESSESVLAGGEPTTATASTQTSQPRPALRRNVGELVELLYWTWHDEGYEAYRDQLTVLRDRLDADTLQVVREEFTARVARASMATDQQRDAQ